MMIIDDLRRSVDKLEELLRQSAGLTEGLNDHRRHGIELRRQIAEQLASVGALGEKALEAIDQAAFRREFSKMRSALAFHQASWPIVSINLNDPEYTASVAALRAASRHFISWVRAILAGS